MVQHDVPEALTNTGKAAVAGTGVILAAPTNEVPGVLDPGKPKRQQPTNDVPDALGSVGPKRQQPTNDVPRVLGEVARQRTNQGVNPGSSGTSGVGNTGSAGSTATSGVGSGQQAANWNGTWSDGVTTATLSGGASSLSGSWTYRTGDSSGSASLSGCRVNQTVASCSMSGSHQDSTKSGTRTGTLVLTLSGNSLAFRYTEGAEPSWSYKPGYSKDNVSSSMHKGATFTGSLTRK